MFEVEKGFFENKNFHMYITVFVKELVAVCTTKDNSGTC